MRNVLAVMALSALILAGCSKEKNEFVQSPEIEPGDNTVTLFVNQGQDTEAEPMKVVIDLDKFEDQSHMANPFRNPNGTNVTGAYSLEEGAYHHTFSAIQNNGGTNGQIHHWTEDFTNIMSTECVQSMGNMAIFVGQVTQATGNAPVGVNYQAMWLVKDNGEGSGASADQRANYWIYSEPDPVSGEPFSICDFTDANFGGDLFALWDWLFLVGLAGEPVPWNYIDVDGGNIQVN